MDSHLRARKRPRLCYHRPVIKKTRAKVHLADLSEDLLSVILSKLPIKDAMRTGILSSKWKHMWKGCSKLKFDGTTVCSSSSSVFGGQEHTQKFIDNVNAVMQQHRCMVVEELVIRFGFDSRLMEHVNTWVGFAVSSRMESLALDLAPAKFRDDQYRFPVELLDYVTLYRLRHLQLSFVYPISSAVFRI
uniref:Uncharacterized protein n=1 Tax=Avena sativa TaxID=4498 RepID=A0ACD6APM5_AVESA